MKSIKINELDEILESINTSSEIINLTEKKAFNKKQNEKNKKMREKVKQIKNKLSKEIGPMLTKNIEDHSSISKRYKKIKLKLKSEKNLKWYIYEIDLKELKK